MVNLQITRDELIEKLQMDIVVVTFKKADGSERNMLCTKQISKIPEEFHPKTEKVVKLDENGNPIVSDVITVWDLEKSDWRSFNFSRVTDIK